MLYSSNPPGGVYKKHVVSTAMLKHMNLLRWKKDTLDLFLSEEHTLMERLQLNGILMFWKESTLEELNLTPLRKNGSYTLSGGERRRLEITRALATNPKFLLLDEPFAGIDPIAVGDIQDILTTLKRKNIGILITDHNVQDTLSITDRAYIISEGAILEAGPPDVIVNSQKARAVYLGERFKM